MSGPRFARGLKTFPAGYAPADETGKQPQSPGGADKSNDKYDDKSTDESADESPEESTEESTDESASVFRGSNNLQRRQTHQITTALREDFRCRGDDVHSRPQANMGKQKRKIHDENMVWVWKGGGERPSQRDRALTRIG